jgi:N6-L-threonylcarbamoyladenine synthase
MQNYILGIESSCDETSASVCYNGKIINNVVATQDIHAEYGGVVPELASREHQKNIIPVVNKAISDAGIAKSELNAIAVTQGPGLLGALLVGYTFAKSMAFALDIPLVNVHHMKAHIAAHYIDDPKPKFPFLCLTVSGGHTQIVKVLSPTKMQVVGQTIDDAVGEAFDKGAKLMGLPYPGGPMIDKLAQKGNPHFYRFSKSDLEGFDFSYSGVKTSLLYFLQKEIKKDSGFIEINKEDIAASYQQTLIEMLMSKLVKAAKYFKIEQIAIAGGVAANSQLRKEVLALESKYGWQTYIPKFEYCTDNAGMIAMEGYNQYIAGNYAELTEQPLPRMSF